jgi:hypothetical protein
MAQPTGRVTLYDGDGVAITTLELDENGEASYSFVLDNEDIGRNNLKAVYTGDTTYAPRGEDNFVLEVVDENGEGGANNKATTVKKIIAGPGIYISPSGGTGNVTISTRPISDAGNETFYRVRWTQSIGTVTKYDTNLSMFMGVGTQGLVMTSDDGKNWSNTGPVNKVGTGGTTVDFNNIHCVQEENYPGDGLIYFNIQEGTFDDGGTPNDYISVIWGALGYTDANGIYKGDNIDKQSSPLGEVGGSTPISAQEVEYAETFVLGSQILSLVFSLTGKIWSMNQLATDFAITAGGSTRYIMRPEATGIGNVQACWSDIEDSGTGSFTIKAVTSTGEILSSSRSGNSQGSWSVEYNGSTSLNGIGYGNGTWIAVGNNDTIVADGVQYSTGIQTNWFSVAYGNGRWVAVGTGGAIGISLDDGFTWTAGQSGTTQTLWDVAYSPKLRTFAAVGAARATVAIKGY